jgi:neutral ceramidase
MKAKSGQLQIGTGRAVLDIPQSILPIEGFSDIHDNLQAKTLLLDNGIDRAAIVGIDLTSISPKLSDHLKSIISKESAVKSDNIILYAGHTYSAPHGRIQDKNYEENIIFYHENLSDKDFVYVEVIKKAVVSSVIQAREHLQPGRMGFGTGQCNVNVNRDMLTSQGYWKCSNFEGPSDKTVSAIRFEKLDGKPIALFINYPVLSNIMSDSVTQDGRKLVSSDLGGATARYVERLYSDEIIALWNTGAAGDQAPLFKSNRYVMDKYGNWGRIDIHQAGYALVELQGERLGYEAFKVSENIRGFKSDVSIKTINKIISCPGQEINRKTSEIQPCKEYDYKKSSPKNLPFIIMILNDVAIIGMQVEIGCKTSLEIKKASPFKNTVIMTMVNGAAKYAADAESYDKITYESMNSMYARGSAEILRDEIISTLNNEV